MPRNTRHYGICHVVGRSAGPTICTRETAKETCMAILAHAQCLLDRDHPTPLIYEIQDDCGRRRLDVHVWGGQWVDILCPHRDAVTCDAARDWEADRSLSDDWCPPWPGSNSGHSIHDNSRS